MIQDSKSAAQMSVDDQRSTVDVDQQLQALSDKLGDLHQRLEEQCGRCATKREKKHLISLRKETKKQLATITKLQDSVEDTITILAKSSQALSNPCAEKIILQREDRAVNDVHDNLFQAVTAPFQNQYRLVQQMRNIELSHKLMPWKRTKPVSRQATHVEDEACNNYATTLEQHPSSISDTGYLSMFCSNESTSSAGHTDLESSSEASEPASSATSACSSPRISVQDWSILTPPEGMPKPPPLPRKSSRRASYTPRVPSISFMPRSPPMPTTPPPSVPDTEQSDPMNNADGGAISASSILSNLEKRYSLTISTPPATP
ncbi:hypothetical protein H2200_002541 [Cladophialophora chaetospira]|uniref:Uncharacterized protein n=1 Tax=Cladophialophora chaetospira TaxID=386627 RepID=A0AA39CNN3_9EURO|nr:hypothetical protein H2200_002541 [Cladophialophora chaetospira]